ncbi:MAG: adenylate/guanylate cyclase domain-containing protein [Mycobacterium sp.]|nr:adenylate/guanylate cyclase domain-containing protein [Mycobacterium sp.]
MTVERPAAPRLARVREAITPRVTHEYGSWLLGRVSESKRRRRVRIQLILTAFVIGANIVGVIVASLVTTVLFPVPNVFGPDVWWITVAFTPPFIVATFVIGAIWASSRVIASVRWALDDRRPTPKDQRSVFRAPGRLTRVLLFLWFADAAVLTTMYAVHDADFIPKFVLGITFPGIVVATSCYLFTEFALRPLAAQALQAGRPSARLESGIMGRTMLVWALGSGVPMLGILLAAVVALSMNTLTETQFEFAIAILALFALIFGFLLMWILAWLTTTPIRIVRDALSQIEAGNLDTDLVVFDGTELGELQRGFNSMTHGLRERERVRDLFGRHVGREVAVLAEQQKPQLGGEERHAAVIFVDVIGSTQLVASRPAAEVVDLLNRFFAVVVDEVDRHHGLVNKFEGDAVLAVFGAPVSLQCTEGDALAAARAIASRLRDEVPELQAGLGVAAGTVVAGNVGAKERFEYTVIGGPVNEAARLCELSKSVPGHLVAAASMLDAVTESECANWTLGDTVTLRGLSEPTQLAVLA